MTIRYALRREEPNRHYVAVRMEFDHASEAPVDLFLPIWTPGAYHIQDTAQWLVDLSAQGGTPPRPVPVERLEKARWRLHPPRGPVEVRFRAYGHAMLTEALDVSDEHLFVNAIRFLPFVDGRRTEPHEIALDVPAGWSVVTELSEIGPGAHRYRAADYDELVDSPIDVGTPKVYSFAPLGIPHRLAVCGPGGNLEPHRFLPDVERVVTETIRYVGESPLTSYTFFLHLHEASDGALEHGSSNSCVAPRFAYRPKSSYDRWLWIAAHEYFHLYLVKRIKPKAFLPYDYTREVYTRLLWLMEGSTDFASLLILRRAALLSPTKYLERLSEVAGNVLTLPGRHHQSLEEASLLAWIGTVYRPQEEAANRQVHYYFKGHLVTWMLDLELRERSENRLSFQDVLRTLWTEYGRPGRGIEEAEFPAIVERATGLNVEEFCRRFIAGTEELDLDRYARLAGLSFGPIPPKREPEDDDEPGDLGAETRVTEGSLRVVSVRDGGPAQHAGLDPGDELVAIDGARIQPREFDELRRRFPSGTGATLTFFRRGYLASRTVTFGTAPPKKFRFSALPEATEKQRALYEGWIGEPWAPPKKKLE